MTAAPMVARFAQARARDVEPVGWARLDADGLLDFSDAEVRPTQADIDYLPVGSAYVPVYPQSAIDTLRAQLEAAEAEKREAWAAVESKAGWEWKKRAEAAEAECARLRGINSDLCRIHNARLVDAAKSEARTKALEAEAERLRGLLQQTAAVGITMLFDSHADDVRGEFSVGELMEVVAVSEPLNAQDAKVEKVYRTAWDAARTKEATP